MTEAQGDIVIKLLKMILYVVYTTSRGGSLAHFNADVIAGAVDQIEDDINALSTLGASLTDTLP